MRLPLAVALMPAVLMTPLARPAAAEESHLVIVVGLGGEAKYTEAFHELALSMIGAAEKKLGVAQARIAYLGEKAAVPDVPVYKGRANRENVQKALGAVAQAARPGDLVFILLIGHGSFQAGESRFNLPGPDMTATDFAPLLAALSGEQVVFVNTSSASGDFVKALSGKGRTIVTATKSGMERNETEFPSYFVEAFTGDKADTDKDERVSVLEAFTYARREVERFYEKGRRLLTEHAVLDDDGDGVGSADAGSAERTGTEAGSAERTGTGTGGEAGSAQRTGTGTGRDGRVAAATFLGTGAEAVAEGRSGPGEPRLVALRQERREVERRIAALKARKDQVPPAEYEDALEGLLLELARKEQSIRQHEAGK